MKYYVIVEENNAPCITNDLFFDYADNLKNPKKLSIAQVRAYDEFNMLSDSDVQDFIDELYQISIVTYKIYLSEINN